MRHEDLPRPPREREVDEPSGLVAACLPGRTGTLRWRRLRKLRTEDAKLPVRVKASGTNVTAAFLTDRVPIVGVTNVAAILVAYFSERVCRSVGSDTAAMLPSRKIRVITTAAKHQVGLYLGDEGLAHRSR